MDPRFKQNAALFGREGQNKLRSVRLAVVGCGGLGTHVAQQTALLGVGGMQLIDLGDLKLSSRNRYVGAYHTDPIPGSRKVSIAERLVRDIDPTVVTNAIYDRLESQQAFAAIKQASHVFGCLDKDGPRFILNELCLAYQKPLIDLASDVPEEGYYGGRVAVVRNGQGCLHCMDVLDARDVRRYLSSKGQLDNEAAEYGVDREQLAPGTGPSVVSINGVVASLGVTEFMAMVTGLREPARLLNYHGQRSTVSKSSDQPIDGCFYCRSVFGSGDGAETERYLANFESEACGA